MATDANARQIGGDHYKTGASFQHWDWVNEIKLPYLAGVASKYVARWRRKGSPEDDLLKAVHYLEKCLEVRLSVPPAVTRMTSFWRFVIENALMTEDAMVCFWIMEGEWETARQATQALLDRWQQQHEQA